MRNPSSIVKGIKGKIKIFAGIATSERLPILYKNKWQNKIYAAVVTEKHLSNQNALSPKENIFQSFGVKYITPTVAIKDN